MGVRKRRVAALWMVLAVVVSKTDVSGLGLLLLFLLLLLVLVLGIPALERRLLLHAVNVEKEIQHLVEIVRDVSAYFSIV